MTIIFDVAVIGGSLRGCLCAMEAARQGLSVVVVEPRAFLGEEFTATLRSWAVAEGEEDLNDDLKYIFFNHENRKYNDSDRAFNIGDVKKNLLNLMEKHRITVLFLSDIAGIAIDTSDTRGVLLGSKLGLHFFQCKSVIDATGNQRVLWMAGAKRRIREKNILVRRTIEYFNVQSIPDKEIFVPGELGLYENKIALHRGIWSDDQVFAEFSISVHVTKGDYMEELQWEYSARMKTQQLAEYLKNNVSEFNNAELSQTSLELIKPSLFYIDHDMNSENRRFRGLYALESGNCSYNSQSFKHIQEWHSEAFRMAVTIKQKISSSIDEERAQNIMVLTGYGTFPIQSEHLTPYQDVRLETGMYSVTLPDSAPIGNYGGYDVIIAGGGTSGAPVAIAAAREGVKTAVIDTMMGLGGTKTFGAVNGYYNGYNGGYNKEIDLKVKTLSQRITGKVSEVHIESKLQAYLDELQARMVEAYLGTKVVGVRMEDSCIKGVIVLNPDGLRLISGKMVVDATGDADVVALAGLEYAYGSEREGMVQTYNHNGFIRGSFNDLGVIDTRLMSEINRGIKIAHQRNSRCDFRPFLTVRESRRIRGEYTVTMADVLMKRVFSDTIIIGKTDCDTHGINSSLLSRMGYLPLRTESYTSCLPYRACIPKELDGILVAAKAYSATRDAFQFFRMSRDIQNLGYAVGLAAAQSIRTNRSPKDIDISVLQKKLCSIGILPEEIVRMISPSNMQKPINLDSLAKGDRETFIQVLCSESEDIIEGLESVYKKCGSEGKVYLAMALAWFGSKTGTKELISTLERLLGEEDGKFHNDLNPLVGDGTPLAGFYKEPGLYWKINQIIILLGLAGDKGALDILCKIIHNTKSGGARYMIPQAYMYGELRVDWVRIPHYDRILSLCFSIERLADRHAIEPMEKLLSQPHIGGYVSKSDIYAGGNLISAYLEVALARALARCGSKTGIMVLIDYLEDSQWILANHVYSELKDISGEDFGHDPVRWKEWMSNCKYIEPKPFTGREERN